MSLNARNSFEDQKVSIYIHIEIQNDYQKNAKIKKSRFSPPTINLEITWKRA